MIREERDDVSRRLANRKRSVIGRRGPDRRGIEAKLDEPLVCCFEILDHQVERCLAWNCSCLRRENQMRASAKLEHGNFRSLNHRAHPDLQHELLCFCQSIGFEDNVADPYRRARVLFAGQRSTRVPAPSQRQSHRLRRPLQARTAGRCAATRCRQSSRCVHRSRRKDGRAQSIRR